MHFSESERGRAAKDRSASPCACAKGWALRASGQAGLVPCLDYGPGLKPICAANNTRINSKPLPRRNVIFHEALLVSKCDILSIFQFGSGVPSGYTELSGMLLIGSREASSQNPLSELGCRLLLPYSYIKQVLYGYVWVLP